MYPSAAPARPVSTGLSRRWDLFCRVVDNYGDAGVCWRLARQLVADHGQQVCLWLDDLVPLSQLHPEISPVRSRQQVAGVDIQHWTAEAAPVCGADVVIEAFACELPTSYRQSLAVRQPAPRWINLEYLSAEDWVEGCHGLASPDPQTGLRKHFFFPGFSNRTGGLLWGTSSADAVLSANVPVGPEHALRVSLFAYDHVALDGLLAAWENSSQPVHCLVSAGKVAVRLAESLGQPLHETRQMGQLTLSPLPFLPQTAYDSLLASCDVNFVRGEDSFVRAQWAGKPLIWQIYPQAENAHQPKLEAFLRRYGADWDASTAAASLRLHQLWNTTSTTLHHEAWCEAWETYLRALPQLRQHARIWQAHYDARSGLAENLVKFSQLPV